MRGRTTLAASLALAGGVAAGVGSFLVWAEISAGPFSERATGIHGWEGKATLIAGIVMAAAGIRVFLGAADAISRLRVRAAIGGLVAAGVGIYTALTAREQLVDAGAATVPRAELEQALETGLLKFALGFGLYVVIAGGIQGVLAALVAMCARDDTPAPSGRGLTGWAVEPPPPPRPGGDPD